MASPERRRGDAWERTVVAYLREAGQPHVERAYGAGRGDDRGDIDGLPRWCLELKACRRLELAAWVDEAEAERQRSGAEFGAVMIKRRGRPTRDGYVVVSLATFARLLEELA